jgi:hypothetical protein
MEKKTAKAKNPRKTSTGTKKKGAETNAVPKGIGRAPEHQYFVLLDGRRLGDIKELADALDDMADHVWNHHVGERHNHFVTWIEDVFKDAELAERLRTTAGKHHAQIVLYRTILERI